MAVQSQKFGYRDVKQEVFKRIRNNQWPPGALLPGEVELAAEFGCARATVNRAMQELSDDGIIDRRRKGGSRVNLTPVRQVTFEIPLMRAEIEAKGADYKYELLHSKTEIAPSWLQEQLALSAYVRVQHVQCIHYADGEPYQYEDRWINHLTVPTAGEVDFTDQSPNEWLISEVPYTNAEVRFSATDADKQVARSLGLGVGDPVFKAERTTWLSDAPVTFVRLYFAQGYEMVAKY